MEPRAGAKENVDRQSTLRAQDRVGVSQALGRIRKAARQNKTEKFTTLLHHVDVRLLRESYLTLLVVTSSAPSISSVAIAPSGRSNYQPQIHVLTHPDRTVVVP